MTLAWIAAEDSEPPQDRPILRNSGQLLGRLDGLFPFLYIAQYGATLRDLRMRWSDAAGSLFAVGEATSWAGDRPGVSPRLGLILPVRLCRNEATASALMDIAAMLAAPGDSALSQRRLDVQARLDRAFGGGLRLSEQEGLDGFCALQPNAEFFQQLCRDGFAYVTEVEDNPAAAVRVTGSSPFGWRSYGELMEWFHSRRLAEPFSDWRALVPFLVSGGTAAISSHSTQRWACIGLNRPTEEPSRWFAIRPDVRNAQIGIRLQMLQHGWACLHLSLDQASLRIALSDVFDPFDDLVAWSREVAEGDLPVEMEIDEEGQEAVLTVLKTDDAERVLFRVTRKDTGEILLEGIVDRSAFGASWRAELRRFFSSEFDPKHWGDERCADAPADDGDESDDDPSSCFFVSVRDRVLQHPWIADGG